MCGLSKQYKQVEKHTFLSKNQAFLQNILNFYFIKVQFKNMGLVFEN